MLTDDYTLDEVLEHLPVSECSYEEWIHVGMALKAAGYDVSAWDAWSRMDSRYKSGDCAKRWIGFRRDGVSTGTIIQYAMDHGWVPAQKSRIQAPRALSWTSAIGGNGDDDPPAPAAPAALDQDPDCVPAPPDGDAWDPAGQMIRYLEALYEPDEYVGYVVQYFEGDDGVKRPTRGMYTLTQSQIVTKLRKYHQDIGAAIGDPDPDLGGYIRINPLDGQGVGDRNVTAFRWALIESDTLSIPQQYAALMELQLPIRIMVHSGGKSLHAIVHIGAKSYDEYRQRVDKLHQICERGGLKPDRATRNPSRLSRLPGLMRAGKKQYIVGEHLGQPDWDSWIEYMDALNDDLPDIDVITEDTPDPELSADLIEGVLRQGHKMLLAGPSKAGKSYLLINLCVSIAEGVPWLGHQCAQGRVMYINLEVDAKSAMHRVIQIYTARGLKRSGNFELWNLRGSAEPLDKMLTKIIRRMRRRQYAAVVIDPLYKVITGDENSAEQMAKFCNLFDRISREAGCAVIYAHHHSKGAQGGKKAMDRSSGSGVFARDPDAILDMIELVLSNAKRDTLGRLKAARLWEQALNRSDPSWRSDDPEVGMDPERMADLAAHKLDQSIYQRISEQCDAIKAQYQTASAFRIEYTLREYEPRKPIQIWYRYPLHEVDDGGELKKARAEGERGTAAEAREAREAKKADRIESRQKAYDSAYMQASLSGPVTPRAMAEIMGVTPKTVRVSLLNYGYKLDKATGTVIPSGDEETDVHNDDVRENYQ